jgi:hypothetical protein
VSVLAKGAVDRVSGEVDRCEKVLAEARSGPSEAALKTRGEETRSAEEGPEAE